MCGTGRGICCCAGMCAGKIGRVDFQVYFDSTIGIGAGNGCDGQVLVYQDMLGMYSDFVPKFVKKFGNVGDEMKAAFRQYIAEVQSGQFPASEHTFAIGDDVLDKLY